MELTPEQFDAALASRDAELVALVKRFREGSAHPLHSWQPRPDQPELHDEQTAFVNCRSLVQVCLGGTGSGKSDAAAFKVAKILLEQQAPPRKDAEFWVLAPDLETAAKVLWKEKLSRFIPEKAIAHIAWQNAGLGYPRAVRRPGLPSRSLQRQAGFWDTIPPAGA